MKVVLWLLVAMTTVCCGCVSSNDISIQPTRTWENHYTSVKDFKAGTACIELQKGESIWVLSNSTLKRVLKNVEK